MALAAVRGALFVIAIPLAPVLYDEHLAVLVLLRPTKEVFLFAGYEVLEGRQNLGVVVLAAVPLLLFATWVFYLLGRSYRHDLDDTDLPGLAGRVLPRNRIQRLRDALQEQGWPMVFLGRLALAPSTLVAAAAGSSGIPVRTFLLADTAGAIVSMSAMLVAGYLLGETYDDAGPAFSIVGGLVLLVVLVLLGRRVTGAGRRRGAPARGS